MSKNRIGNRIKELRNNKGLSQEKLAEDSGVSLRTVQRIELGESDPRGDTLKLIGDSFGISIDEISTWTKKEDQGFLSLLHLSSLSFLLFPLLGTILPMALWLLKRDKIKNVDYVGKRIINFEITWSLCLFLSYVIVVSLYFFKYLSLSPTSLHGFYTQYAWFGFMYIFNGALIIYNLVRAKNNKKVIYQPAIRFLR